MRISYSDYKSPSRLFIAAIAFALFTHQSIHAADTHASFLTDFRLTQQLAATGEYDATGAFDSFLLDARMKLTIPDMTNVVREPDSDDVSIDSFAFRLKPISRLAIHVGALTVSGLPARAKNPLFSLTSPFHEPTKPENGPTFGLGSAKKTDNVAIEYRTTECRFAVCTTAMKVPMDSAWISTSKEFRSFSEENEYLVLSLFSGIKRIEPKVETSWFVNEPLASETSILMNGAECLFRKGAIGGSLTGFGNFASARRPDALSRSELFVDDGIFRISGGYFRSGRNFLDFDGESSRVLSRLFLAPQCIVAESWTFGAIFLNDTAQGDKYYCDNISAYTQGGGIKYEATNFRFRLQAMRKEEETVLSASIYRNALGLRFLSASILTSCEIPGSKPVLPEKATVSGSLGISPFKNRSKGVEASIGYRGSFKKTSGSAANATVHKSSLEIAGFCSSRHVSWRCALQGSVSTDGAPPEGSITLELDLP